MKKFVWVVSLSFLLILVFRSFVPAVRYDGPYKGKIIDADTGNPIEGAVILGVWYSAIITPAGSTSRFYDAKETVTDKNGEFLIDGLGLQVFSNVEPMHVLIFKAGYEHLGLMLWLSLKEDILLKERIKWQGNMAIIPLRKLTLDERKKRFGSYYVNIPEGKKKLLSDEIAKEDIDLMK